MKTKDYITQFEQKVYEACSKIPEGNVSTYKEIAHALHSKAYRAVGSALRNNPFAPKVPCHRVVSSDGRLGGFMGSTNPKSKALKKKTALLAQEGLEIKNGKIKEFEKRLFNF